MLRSYIVSKRTEHVQTNVHLQSAFLAKAPGFRSSSRTDLAALEPPKQPIEVSKHAYPGELQIAENLLEGGASLRSQ